MKVFKSIILLASISLFSFEFISCNKCDHNYEIVNTIEATCTKVGSIKYQCTLCDDEKIEPLLSTGHDFNEYTIIYEGNCLNQGIKQRTCSKCNLIDEIKFNNIVHEFEITRFDATCTTEGYELKTCKICSNTFKDKTSNPLEHNFSDWKIIEEATDISDGIEKRECDRCHLVEQQIIPSTSYINLDIIRNNLDLNGIIVVDNITELQLVFDTAVLNNINTVEVDLNFDNINLENLLNELVNNCSIDLGYKVNVSYGRTLVINLTYNKMAEGPCSDVAAYSQYASLNYQSYNSERANNFDDFKINNSNYQYEVSTSEQLYYVLERGTLPIVKKGSSAELMYSYAKEILRNIIDDKMTDFEKIKAIHDYLILNTTYDDALLQLSMQNPSDISKYNGFYLEGVFIDKRAVCEGISKAFSVLCNIEGIRCVVVTGVQANNPYGIGHAWNKVYLDGHWYIVDVTSDGTIINNNFEILSYQYFLISETKMNQRYVGVNFNNIVCEFNYDVYGSTKFDENANFVVESFDELVALVAYFEKNCQTNSTIEFKVDFNYGSSFIDELENAYNKLHLAALFSHINNDDVFVIIK